MSEGPAARSRLAGWATQLFLVVVAVLVLLPVIAVTRSAFVTRWMTPFSSNR